MGLFSIFKKSNNTEILENTVMGYMRMEIENLLSVDMRSTDYNQASLLAAQLFQADLAFKIDKEKLQEMMDIFLKISKNRVDELFGTYIVLISIEHTNAIRVEDVTPNILVESLNNKIKALINQVNSI